MQHVSELLPAIAKEKQFRKSDLKLLGAAVAIRQELPDEDDLVFMAKELVQCTLPHRDPGKAYEWTRTNGNLTLGIVHGPGLGYPYGSIPRLLLFWLTREAVRTQSRRIKLGNSFYAFMVELGFNPNGGGGPRSDYKRVKEQTRRLLSAYISFSTGNDTTTERRLNMQVASRSELWWTPTKPNQVDLWESWIELGEDFFRAITALPVPLDSRVLRALKQSPLALDLYAWAAHKVYSVKRKGQSQFVPWKGLHTQFGADYSDVKDFRRKARAALRKIAVTYPELKLEFVPGGVVILPTSQLAVVYQPKSTKALVD